jgi:hypothetical protein
VAGASGAVGVGPSVGYCACLRRELAGEPDAGNLHLRFDEGRVGRATCVALSPTLPPGPAKGRDGRNAPCSSSAMSSGRLFLDRGARQQSPSPLYRQLHPKTVPGWGTINLQRTANSVLTVCLSQGDNRMPAPQSIWRKDQAPYSLHLVELRLVLVP